MYGQEGSRIDRKPPTCEQVIGSFNCPFRTHDASELTTLISTVLVEALVGHFKMSLTSLLFTQRGFALEPSQMENVLGLSRNADYKAACREHFALLRTRRMVEPDPTAVDACKWFWEKEGGRML